MKKDNHRVSKNPLIQIASFIGLLSLIILSFLLLTEHKMQNDNPYALDVEGFNKIDPALYSHHLYQEIGVQCGRLYGVAVDKDDFIYAATDSRIIKYNPFGSEVFSFEVPEAMRTLAINSKGQIYTSSVNRIYVFNPEGYFEGILAALSDSSIITSLAIEGNDVFIADAGTRIVAHFDSLGKFNQHIGGRDRAKGRTGFVIPSPFFDLAIDENRSLWVVNPGMHLFENYSFDGELLNTWGKHSPSIQGFCGCCNPSHFAFMPDGRIVTSEKGLVRVKIYSATGQFESVVAGPDQFEKHATGLDICVDSQSRIIIAEPANKSIHIYTTLPELTHGQ